MVRITPSASVKRDWPRMLPVFDGLICSPRRLVGDRLCNAVLAPAGPIGFSGTKQADGSDTPGTRVTTAPLAFRQTLGKTMLLTASHCDSVKLPTTTGNVVGLVGPTFAAPIAAMLRRSLSVGLL